MLQGPETYPALIPSPKLCARKAGAVFEGLGKRDVLYRFEGDAVLVMMGPTNRDSHRGCSTIARYNSGEGKGDEEEEEEEGDDEDDTSGAANLGLNFVKLRPEPVTGGNIRSLVQVGA